MAKTDCNGYGDGHDDNGLMMTMMAMKMITILTVMVMVEAVVVMTVEKSSQSFINKCLFGSTVGDCEVLVLQKLSIRS